MIKLLLVDDEAMEREGLRDYMPWDQLGIEVAGEASDGMQALRLAEALKPDIVITDIKMPGMDGIEFVARLKEQSPTVKVIFISVYSDFEYARNAVMLNAFGYVLKPVNFYKLSEVLGKVVAQIKEELYSTQQKEELRQQIRENQRSLQNQFLVNVLVHGKSLPKETLYKRAEYLDLALPEDHFYVAVACIDDYKRLEELLTEESKQFLNITLLNLLNDAALHGASLYPVQIRDGIFAVIVNTSSRGVSFKKEMIRTFEACLNKMSAVCAGSATVGISDLCRGIEDIPVAYEQALSTTKAKWYLGKGQIIFFSDISIANSIEEVNADMSDQIREISQYTFAGDMNSAADTIHRLFENMKGWEEDTPQSIRNACLLLMHECRRLLAEIDDNPDNILGSYFSIYETVSQIETRHELESWLVTVLKKVDDRIQQKKNAKGRRLVDRIIEVINRRYHENLSIEDISNEVFFSSNYIRKVFKDETGQTITEYLLQVRMKKATELMRDSQLHVHDIGQRIGYENISYFCQVFKQYYGVTPKEYMDSLVRR
jgi:two-component system response regulator YesN